MGREGRGCSDVAVGQGTLKIVSNLQKLGGGQGRIHLTGVRGGMTLDLGLLASRTMRLISVLSH